DCLFESCLTAAMHHAKRPPDRERLSTVVVQRNYFAGADIDCQINVFGTSIEQLVIRHNVFAGKSRKDITFNELTGAGAIELSNNTLSSTSGIVFYHTIPHSPVVIRNNLRAQAGFIEVREGAEKGFPQAVRYWSIDHNVYHDAPGGSSPEQIAPRSPGDLNLMPRFLSKVPHGADFLRISADDPLANAGAGGEWPTYLGGLNPGPAPRAGDWFTRLKARWSDSSSQESQPQPK
ncbi:MAG: hypothetical protein ACKVT0_10405, partial [Planctomycetaceae bacterium]